MFAVVVQRMERRSEHSERDYEKVSCFDQKQTIAKPSAMSSGRSCSVLTKRNVNMEKMPTRMLTKWKGEKCLNLLKNRFESGIIFVELGSLLKFFRNNCNHSKLIAFELIIIGLTSKLTIFRQRQHRAKIDTIKSARKVNDESTRF
jgi:hypothetical protein